MSKMFIYFQEKHWSSQTSQQSKEGNLRSLQAYILQQRWVPETSQKYKEKDWQFDSRSRSDKRVYPETGDEDEEHIQEHVQLP